MNAFQIVNINIFHFAKYFESSEHIMNPPHPLFSKEMVKGEGMSGCGDESKFEEKDTMKMHPV